MDDFCQYESFKSKLFSRSPLMDIAAQSMLTSYHNHCYLDDGRGSPEEYAENAITQGFHALGFSCHAPLPYPNDWALPKEKLPTYLQEVGKVKERYAGRVNIHLGLEADFIPDVIGPSDWKYTVMNLEYIIGSVHSLKDEVTGQELPVDGSPEEIEQLLKHSFDGQMKNLCETYFQREIRMIEEHNFDILGHCDLVRKLNTNNRFFDPEADWYREMAVGVLDAAAHRGVILEVNTGAIARGYTTEFYPSYWLLKRAWEKNIPLTLNADAHHPAKIAEVFASSRSIIKRSGYKTLMYLDENKWREAPI